MSHIVSKMAQDLPSVATWLSIYEVNGWSASTPR